MECFPLGELDGRVLHTERTGGGSVMWFGPPAAAGPEYCWRATGELTVPSAGRWVLSLVQIEDARLLLDGEVVLDGEGVDLPPGADFFGAARRELTVELELSPERPVHLELRSQVTGGGLLLGAKVGIRPGLPVDAVDRAVAAARTADAVVVIVGTDGDWETEGHDRDSMDLPGGQAELVEQVLDVAPDAVVVLNVGSPVTLPFADRCRALLQCWFGGVELAEALADVLFGEADPGGRLPTTIPRRLRDNPTWGNARSEDGRTLYGERLLVGYRWYESRGLEVTFPFGHGLSYSRFEIGEPALSATGFGPGDRLTVRVPVTNVGDRHGTEVVQLYVAPRRPRVFRPEKELKGFAKVALGPGEAAVVELVLDDRSFARWSAADDELGLLLERQGAQAPFMPRPDVAAGRGWVVDPGPYDLHVGRSSADIAHVVGIEVDPGAG